MSNYVRKLVSGNKARFKDDELDVDLDLVYVTDQLIIMGFPAGGLEGFYRNRREDAKKFLAHRHPNNYWVFNFCPLSENSYDATVFNGRVSRYPFPDHHAPPLAILALAAREIRLWLEGSSDRVAVLHCKAGKGRSGTLACAYLLSLDISPEPPRLQRSYTAKQWAKLRAEEWMDVVETDDMPKDESPPDPDADQGTNTPEPSTMSAHPPEVSAANLPPVGTQGLQNPSTESTLEKVLALHTSRRMKAPSPTPSSSSKSEPKKPKQGVSIPSQRRFLLYWSLLLSRTAPTHLWPLKSPPAPARPKVKLRQITVRLREGGGAKMTIVKVVNAVLEKAAQRRTYTNGQDDKSRGKGDLWISLARYDDEFVELLEDWERRTRDEGNFGKRHKDGGVDTGDEKGIADIFEGGKWDKSKMVRSFARLGRVDQEVGVQEDAERGRIFTHVLTPLNRSRWTVVQKSITEHSAPAPSEVPQSMKEENDDVSFDDTLQVGAHDDDGIILDAGREVRAKLYLGQVFMGWLWFIPTFHMPQPPPRASEGPPPAVHLHLGRKDVDFPLGAGAWIVDINVEMAWVPVESEAALEKPPQRQTSGESIEGKGGEPAEGGLLAGAGQLAAGESVAKAVETVQAARD